MDELIAYAKEEILRQLYDSVNRMNLAIVRGDEAAYLAEVEAQKDLRKSFEQLQEE